MGQVAGIDGVSFGTSSDAPGEVTGLSGIDDSDGYGGIDQMADERSLVTTGSFDDDQLEGWVLTEFMDECVVPLGIVGQTQVLGQWPEVNVELVLGNVNSHPEGNGSAGGTDSLHPVLQMRTRFGGCLATVLAAVRAGIRGAAAILLRDGVLNT